MPRTFKRIDSEDQDKKELLTILPGKASVTWAEGVVEAARAQGAECDDQGILKTSEAKRARVATTAGPCRSAPHGIFMVQRASNTLYVVTWVPLRLKEAITSNPLTEGDSCIIK